MAIDVILLPPAAHLGKARDSLTAARALLDVGGWEAAVSRLFYATMQVAYALLATRGLLAHTHKGTQTLLGLHFVREGTLPPDFASQLGRLQADRELADYGAPHLITAERAKGSRAEAVALIDPMLALLAAADPETRAAVAPVATALRALSDPTAAG